MSATADDLRKQFNDLWKQAIDQLEDVKEAIVRSTDRFEVDLQRLRIERDRLLKTLGEQTYKLANQGKVPLPRVVKRTVDRLNDVIDRMVVGQAKKKTKKKAANKTTKKAKATKKKAKKTKKR